MKNMKFASTDNRNSLLMLGAFLLLVIGVGGLIGMFTAPGEWYAELDKPPFNPPNWIFAPVWTLLYVAVAVAGWRIWRVAPKSGAMRIWGVQMLLNWLWSPVFFAAQLLWPAVVVLLLMWLSIAAFIRAAWPLDRTAGWLFVPYLAWVSFAAILNISVAVLN